MNIPAGRGGQGFENRIEPSFDAYSENGIALVDWLPVPTAPAPGNPRMRMFKGKAPFDIYGYTIKDARFIGAECKETGEHKPSLRIVPSEVDGSGLEEHQLAALCSVAIAGGIARVIWDNGGQVLVLDNEQIVFAYATFASSKETGAKSIRKELFKAIEYTQVGGRGIPVLDWLLLPRI